MLRWRVVEEYYDDAGVLVESFVLGDCHVADAPHNVVPMAYALNIPAGQWHTLRALESGTVILEMKDGAYEPIGAEDVMEGRSVDCSLERGLRLAFFCVIFIIFVGGSNTDCKGRIIRAYL